MTNHENDPRSRDAERIDRETRIIAIAFLLTLIVVRVV